MGKRDLGADCSCATFCGYDTLCVIHGPKASGRSAVAAAAEMADRPALTADEIRMVVDRAYHAEHGSRGWGSSADAGKGIAERVVTQFAGRRIPAALDSTSRAIAGQPAADLNARLDAEVPRDEHCSRVGGGCPIHPRGCPVGATPAQQTYHMGPADTAVIDFALDFYDRMGICVPHADIARIRAALTGTVIS